MTILSHGLLVMSILSSVLDEGPATEIRYNGTLTPDGRDTKDFVTKEFEVYCLVVNQKEGRDLNFLVDEAGGGGWPWPERFGTIRLDASHKTADRTRVRLLHAHAGTNYPVEVRTPLFEFGDRLEPEAEWKAGKQAYEVVGKRKVKGRGCWVVEVSTNFGRQQTLMVDQQSHFIVAAQQRVFMGQGDRYELKLELESIKSIDQNTLAAWQTPLETIANLQRTLNRSQSEEGKPELTDVQLKAAAAVVDSLTTSAAKTPFENFVKVVRRDVESQQQRVDDVAGLAKKFVGTTAPKLSLKKLSGGSLSADEYADQIVVLHFWEYRNKPLVEPYGQVGYLDFLNNKNIKRRLNVKTYGIAVDKRLADPSQRTAAMRSARQLKEFFNLGYPILLDDGTLLGKFGDPRRLDAQLPLWVVIDADGKIAHYSTGFFSIKPDQGLKQLEGVIVDLVKKTRDGDKE